MMTCHVDGEFVGPVTIEPSGVPVEARAPRRKTKQPDPVVRRAIDLGSKEA
jgi:hypothetical protein